MTGLADRSRKRLLVCRGLAWLALAVMVGGPAWASEIEFSTFLGGSKDDYAEFIARTPDGGMVIVGETHSPDFPTLRAIQSSSTDKGPYRIWDAFVVKLDTDGTAIEFATLLGGSGRDRVNSAAVDLDGNIYVAGRTHSPDFPIVNGLEAPAGWGGFLTKISPNGQEILFSTLLGAVPEAIAFERNGRVFIAGEEFSEDYFDLPSGQATPYRYSAFVASIDTVGGGGVKKVAFAGGSDSNLVTHLAWDSRRNILWAGGLTTSSDFPLLRPVRQVSDFNVGDDGFGTGFLLRFKVARDELLLKSSSLLPGPLQGLAVDRKGRPHVVIGKDDLWITGWEDITGGGDIEGRCLDESYYFRVQASGRQLQNVQCPAIYFVTDLAVDRRGRVVLAGVSDGYEDPPLVDPVQTSTGPDLSRDLYVAVLAKGAAQTLFGTYLGGRGIDIISDFDRSGGLAISAAGNEIFLAGSTTSRNFPVVTPIQTQKLGGGRRTDAFVTKLRVFDQRAGTRSD